MAPGVEFLFPQQGLTPPRVQVLGHVLWQRAMSDAPGKGWVGSHCRDAICLGGTSALQLLHCDGLLLTSVAAFASVCAQTHART